MALYVTWLCLLSAPSGHFGIMLHLDCGLILLQMHLESGWFNCKDYVHACFVKGICAWTLYTIRLKTSFICI